MDKGYRLVIDICIKYEFCEAVLMLQSLDVTIILFSTHTENRISSFEVKRFFIYNPTTFSPS